MADDGFLVDRFLASSPNASVLAASSLRRMTSASTSVRRTTTFSDFLSDSDDDEDFDGGVERMQQQADDMTYFQDAVFEGGSPPDDDDNALLGASPPEDQSPPTAPRTTEASRATTTMSRATMSLRATTSSRRTVGRLTNVRAPAVLRRLTSLKRRRKDKKAAAAAAARGTLSDVGGVILDSDESASERGSHTDGLHDSDEERPPRQSKLSKYSEHDSSVASSYKGNGESFVGAAPAIAHAQDDGHDDSFYQRDKDHDDSFYRPNNNDDSFYRPNSNDDSFHQRPKNDDSFHHRNDSGKPSSNNDSFYERPKNDDSFYKPNDDDSFYQPSNDDSFYQPSNDDSFYERPKNAKPDNNDESFYQRNDDDDSFYAPHDRSFKAEKETTDDDSGDDTSFVGRHAEKNKDDDSFYRRPEDDTSFYGARPAVVDADDDDDGMDLHDHSGDEEDETDRSFVGAPPVQQQHHHHGDDDNDDDDEFVYDDDGYDAEEEEQRRRDKEAAVREHEAEVRASHRFSYRVSEEPFGQVARASHRFSYRMTEEPFGQIARASGVIGFEELEALGEAEAVADPYASSASVDSVSSSVNGGGFFVESVRGSSDSIAPLMDLASPAPSIGAMSTSSGSGGSSLSASALMRSGDLSFRTSFVAVSQQSFPATSPAPFSRSQQPVSPVVASARLTASTHRESSSSSSSDDLLVDESDASFSSNIDDSFTGRPRASSGDDSNLSFLFKNHVTSGCNDPDAVADAVAAVDTTVAVALKTQDKDAASEPPVGVAVKEKKTPSVVWPPKKETPPEAAPPKRSVAAWPPIKKEETVPIVAAVAVATKKETPSVPATVSAPVAKVSPPPVTVSPPPATVSPPVVAAAAAVAPAVAKPSTVSSSVAADSDTRKTTKFAKPKPPARKRGPPQGKQNAGAAAAAAAAVASAAAAATVSIVHGAAATTASATASAAASVATTTASTTAASVPATPVKAAAPDASMALSPRASDNKLDFTGVFLGEAVEDSAPVAVSSPVKKPSQAEDVPANKPRTVAAPEPARPSSVSSKPETEVESTVTATDSEAPAPRRVVSAQEASERKVAEFFRSTYIQNDDDDDLADLLGSATTRARAQTAANRAMANERDTAVAASPPMLTSMTRARRSSTSAMKTVDLKHLTGQRIDDLLRANEEESKDDEETYSDVAASEAPARKRTLSRPFPVNEDLLEKFPSRASTASSVAMANRRPPPHTPLSAYSVSSSGSSLPDSERPFSSHVIQRNFTLSLASGTVGKSEYSISPRTERSSPNAIPLPPNYMLSPRRDHDRPSSSLGSFHDDDDDEEKSFGKSGPAQLPSLTVHAKALAGGSAAKSPNASSSYSSSVSSSSGIHAVAPGFRWHPDANQTPQAPGYKASHESQESSDDGSLGIKESIWHAAGAQLSMTNRPSAAPTLFQRASATVQTSLRRVKSQFLPFRRHYSADVPTSPQSIVAAPPQLPRGFDDREFYPRLGNIPCGDAILVVHKSSRGHATKQQATARRRRTQAWLLLLGILFGLVLGSGLSFVDALAPTFRVRVNATTGERSVAPATKWLLLPGSLFLRIWNCVALPLLFCQVVNGMAELAMTQKTASVLSLRTVLYLVGVALLATLEGVGMALVYHALGLFRSSQRPLQTAAASVRAAVRVADRVHGMAALLCAAGETYLQAPQNGTTWQCSNETIPLPVESGINVTGRGQWLGSSAAVFAFSEVPKVSSHAASSSSLSYYPTGSASVGDVLSDLVASVSPSNVAGAFSVSSASAIVAVAVAVGLVVGLRAFHRAITAQHFLQTSQSHRHRSKATLLAETILAKPHPVLGVLVELQQLLEWLAERLQCLTPFGVASLLAGHMVLHRDEWATVPGPVLSLILGVALASLVHVLLLSPLLVLLVTRVNAWRSLASFLPAMALSFATGNVALSVPVAAHNFEAAQVVTKSMAQVGMGLGVALQRTGHALYYPLVLLFLLETTTPNGAVPMTVSVVLLLAGLTFLSCFVAAGPGPSLGLPGPTASGHLQLVLALFKVWTAQQLSGSATLPLVVVADVVLGHVAALVTTHDHVVLTRLMAEHCAELCIRPGEAGAYQAGASPVYL